jgi:hypothetical protein
MISAPRGMFSLFKRKGPSAPEATFKTRVERFWEWFTIEAARLYAVVDAGQSATLADEITTKVESLGLGAWVFGPGAGGVGHSLTVTGEGDLHRQLLTIYWVSRAPKIDKWTFYPSRQPGPVKGWSINIGNAKFDPMEYWLVPSVNLEDEKIDLQVWHPRFDSMDEKTRGFVLFLFLDEALGEYGTQRLIGKVSYNPKALGEAIPITELKDYVDRVQAQNEWRKLAPGEGGTIYQLGEPHARFRRGDIISISTMNPKLLMQYLDAAGQLSDPLKGTGADYVYVSFERGWLPRGGEVAKRGEIEDCLDRVLKNARSGRLIGGAMGTENAYIDLMIFDGQNSLQIVRELLEAAKLPKETSINYFAKEKVGWRVVL